MNAKKRKKKGNQKKQMCCPYCGSPVVFRSADGIYRDNKNRTMLYVCARYPECDAYVRAHKGTKKPMGSLADHNLRSLRREASSAPRCRKHTLGIWVNIIVGRLLRKA